jgi:hypothetical protein
MVIKAVICGHRYVGKAEPCGHFSLCFWERRLVCVCVAGVERVSVDRVLKLIFILKSIYHGFNTEDCTKFSPKGARGFVS